jgi:DNA-binding FadR family transcriptional regulator
MTYKKNTLTPDLRLSTKTIGEHRDIFNFIKKGDVDNTEKAMKHHLNNIEEYLVNKETAR